VIFAPHREKGGPPSVQAFPWASLDAVSCWQATALRDVHRWLSGTVVPARFMAALGSILGARLDVRARRVEPIGDAQPLYGGVGVLLARAGDPSAETARIEMDGALACTLAARALGRAPPVVIRGEPPPPAVGGAVAALLAAAARRAHAGVALRVEPASGGPRDLRDGGESDGVAVTLTVLLDDDAYAARVIAGGRLLRAAHARPWDQSELSRLGALPLPLSVVAVATASTVAELDALGPGDVLLPGRWHLAVDATGDLAGPVLLSPPRGAMGVRAELVEGRRLVVRGQEEPLDVAERTMAESAREGGWVGAVGEVPVVLRVEVGEAVMAARDWASLSPGDVIGLGTRIGAHVLLRVGGVPVARGELVDIEGEVGVRIVARLGEEPTAR
jgi:flagellar motor switch/type III secretory pathway protein FliN